LFSIPRPALAPGIRVEFVELPAIDRDALRLEQSVHAHDVAARLKLARVAARERTDRQPVVAVPLRWTEGETAPHEPAVPVFQRQAIVFVQLKRRLGWAAEDLERQRVERLLVRVVHLRRQGDNRAGPHKQRHAFDRAFMDDAPATRVDVAGKKIKPVLACRQIDLLERRLALGGFNHRRHQEFLSEEVLVRVAVGGFLVWILQASAAHQRQPRLMSDARAGVGIGD